MLGCFLGVFVASKAEVFDEREALEKANLAGAIKATKHETRGSPSKKELKKYLRFKEHSEVTG